MLHLKSLELLSAGWYLLGIELDNGSSSCAIDCKETIIVCKKCPNSIFTSGIQLGNDTSSLIWPFLTILPFLDAEGFDDEDDDLLDWIYFM